MPIQSIQRVQSNGRYTLPGTGIIQVNVNVVQFDFTTGQITVQGSMVVESNAFIGNAQVKTVGFSQLDIFGKEVPHAVMVSNPFSFIDLAPFGVTECVMTLTLTQAGPFGQGSFRITRVDTGDLVMESLVQGVFGEVPFTAGSVTITS